MSEELPPDDDALRRSSCAAPVWFVVVLIVGYPLSIGPAALTFERLGLRGTPISNVMESAYRPINWVVSGFAGSWLDKGLRWWVELWSGL